MLNTILNSFIFRYIWTLFFIIPYIIWTIKSFKSAAETKKNRGYDFISAFINSDDTYARYYFILHYSILGLMLTFIFTASIIKFFAQF